MSQSTKDRVLAEYANIVDSFTNLLRSAKVAEDHADLGRQQPGARVPGELMQVFAEKLLASAGTLLVLGAELQRNALLNDFAARNADVAAARAEQEAAAAELRERHRAAQQQIQQVLLELQSQQGGQGSGAQQ